MLVLRQPIGVCGMITPVYVPHYNNLLFCILIHWFLFQGTITLVCFTQGFVFAVTTKDAMTKLMVCFYNRKFIYKSVFIIHYILILFAVSSGIFLMLWSHAKPVQPLLLVALWCWSLQKIHRSLPWPSVR